MKLQVVTSFLGGVLTAVPVTAQIAGNSDGTTDFFSDGPFALHVKGQGGNSSVDGYISTLPMFNATQWLLQYEAGGSFQPDNSSYRFYFNYTGQTKSQGIDTGFFVTDYIEAEPNALGLKGKALSLRLDINTNVALPVLGLGTAAISGFNADNKVFLTHYWDDSSYVPGIPPTSQDYRYYNWAVCWQSYAYGYAPVLSWVTAGRPHNPTCELVDLLKVSL